MDTNLKSEAETFNARDYFLALSEEGTVSQDDFDARAWFMAAAADEGQEPEAARLERLLGVSFRGLRVQAGADDGFDFRYQFPDPANFSTERVHDDLVRALEGAGYNPVVTQVALVLDNGMTTGTFFLAD